MLTNRQVEALKPAATRYLKTDERGLCIDVLPSGVKSWVYRYRLHGKQQKTWLGQYPALSLRNARNERDRLALLVKAGKSPAEEKRQNKVQARGGSSTNPTVLEFCDRYYREMVENKLKEPAQIRRYIDKEICCPALALKDKLLRDVTKFDVKELVHPKARSGKVRTALHIRGILKRIFDYAIDEDLLSVNPAAMIKPRSVGRVRSRTRALTPGEIRIFVRTVEQSDIMRQFKVALRIILLTLVRKGELIQARWEHVNFQTSEWTIPAEHTKMDKPHVVYLSAQVADLFRELKVLSCGSELVLPGRDSLSKPICENTLNTALDRLTFDDVPPFTIHDMRRTGSTLLHGNGFPIDAIELALGHSISGVRGIYNRAQYSAERRRMLAWWADYIDNIVDGGKVIEGNFGRA